MKRILSGAVVALTVIGAGALASACDVTPDAAVSNGTSISTAALNNQMAILQDTVAGGCLLQLEDAQLSTFDGQGAGGPGTYTTAFAGAVLNNQVGDLLAAQFAASKGISVPSSDLAAAKSDLESTLSGEISQQVANATSTGTVSYCALANGSGITGQELLSALPSAVQVAQIHNQAVDEKLLARGADLSGAAVLGYYGANLGTFTQACVSVIAVQTQAEADSLASQLAGGASFAALAKANSTDSTTAANGGSIGCNYTLAQVEQSLGVTSVTTGKALTPVQNSSGQWLVYEVTSQAVEPLTSVASLVKRELLQTTANVNRVSREIVAFAHRSDVHVNPQYGSWKGLAVIPPVAPPAEYLLAAVGGTSSPTALLPSSSTGSGSGSSVGSSSSSSSGTTGSGSTSSTGGG